MRIKQTYDSINNLRKEAYLAKCALSSSSAEASREHFSNYMIGSIVNPTRGMLAYKEVIENSNPTNTINYHKNISSIMNIKDIRKLFKMFAIRVNKLYPKTISARSFLIDTERVTFDNVTKVKHNPRRTIFKLFGI